MWIKTVKLWFLCNILAMNFPVRWLNCWRLKSVGVIMCRRSWLLLMCKLHILCTVEICINDGLLSIFPDEYTADPVSTSQLVSCMLMLYGCWVSWTVMSVSCVWFSYCNLLQFIIGDTQKSSLSQLMILLCHAYPIIRKTTATKLYETVLMYPGVISDDCVDEVTSLLIETLW